MVSLIADIDVKAYNEWAFENSIDDVIYESLEELADVLGDEASEFARRVFFGNVQTWNGEHSFYKLDGYANVEEVRFIDELDSRFFEEPEDE